jgi:hypothetical protein
MKPAGHENSSHSVQTRPFVQGTRHAITVAVSDTFNKHF